MPIIFFTAAASKQFHKLTSDAHFRAFTLFKNVNYDCSFPPNEKWKNSRNPYPFWYKPTPETPKFVTQI